ncbi:hypothetical protein NPS01_42350 [Nocardioides psychrotolerans]|uniref:DUF3618 domain-containing protein n=1 Tax=Nocardioides psychrotolerans TaxID=1005945 RepID=A0A1I3DQB8_9ACTN|nr:hypothetical protein [Nocardioides psychrotolerans]GEP40572.1 hypothetical protein NPS01_42350 [Nocardioides psychrotolerans]SFH88937.1 hypothetical protein SAMN05216561_10336 [Nocardioides psychrotolerans]
MTTSSTQERAHAAASTAADEGQHVAAVAKDEVRAVAAEAASQARGLADDAISQVTDQLDEQTRTQRDRLVETLHTLSDDLDQMASSSQAPGLAADLTREVADRARTIGSHLDGRDPAELLENVRSFARRRPGTFLLGALVLGVVAGRVVRGAKDAGATQSSAPAVPPVPTTPAAPIGDATVPVPVADTPAIPPSTSPFDADRPAFDQDGPMGTDAAGYGERSGETGRAL